MGSVIFSIIFLLRVMVSDGQENKYVILEKAVIPTNQPQTGYMS